MKNTLRIRAALLGIGLAMVVGTAAVPMATEARGAELIPLHVKGTATNESEDPTRFVFTVDVFSLSTGEQVGTLKDVITCSTSGLPPCLVLDVASTFSLAQGEIENHAQWSAMPDPNLHRIGFLLVGSRPEGDTVEGKTRSFAGRTGRLDGSGTVDARGLPGQLDYDIFSVIRLNSR